MTDENVETKAGTWDAIGKALADEVRSATDARTFVPAYVWQVVAAALPSIDEAVEKARGRGDVNAQYDLLAKKLRLASGFDELSGESVRQYRSRIKSGKYDDRLAKIGFRRVGNRIEAIADLPQVEHPFRNKTAVIQEPHANLAQRAVRDAAVKQPPLNAPSDDATPTRLR